MSNRIALMLFLEQKSNLDMRKQVQMSLKIKLMRIELRDNVSLVIISVMQVLTTIFF